MSDLPEETLLRQEENQRRVMALDYALRVVGSAFEEGTLSMEEFLEVARQLEGYLRGDKSE